MKNIFLLPTDKPSRLWIDLDSNELKFEKLSSPNSNECTKCLNQHLYITSEEEVEEGDWVIENHTFKREHYIGKCFYPQNDGTVTDVVLKRDLLSVKYEGHYIALAQRHNCKKIILTTDPDLIKDGIQGIDSDFLEWFVKNPTCEEIEIFYGLFNAMGRQMNPMNLTQNHSQCVWKYKINIPKEKSISYEEFRVKASEGLLEQFDVDCLNYSEDKDSERYFYEYCIYWESKLKAESKSSIITTRKPERAPYSIAISKVSPGVELIPNKEYYFRGNKNETPEDAAAKYACGWGKDDDELSFLEGVKWQAGRSYNDEEVMSLLHKFMDSKIKDWHFYSTKKWFEQYKK